MAIMTLGRSTRGKGGMVRNLNVRVNMAAWYRYRIGLTNINGACSAWADQSGNMNTLAQGTASLRPLVRSDGALVFDGVGMYLQNAFTLAQPYTLYMAFNQTSWVLNAVLLAGFATAIKVAQTTATPGIAANGGSGLTVDNTIAAGANGVFAFVGNGTSSVYQAAGGAASVTTTGDAGTNAPGGLTIGASQVPGNYSNIAVYELIAYSAAHDATTRLQVLRYLGRIAQVGGIT